MGIKSCKLRFVFSSDSPRNISLDVISDNPDCTIGTFNVSTEVTRKNNKYVIGTLPLRNSRRQAVKDVFYSQDFQKMISDYHNSGLTRQEVVMSVRLNTPLHKRRNLGLLAENEKHRGWRETHYTLRDD